MKAPDPALSPCETSRSAALSSLAELRAQLWLAAALEAAVVAGIPAVIEGFPWQAGTAIAGVEAEIANVLVECLEQIGLVAPTPRGGRQWLLDAQDTTFLMEQLRNLDISRAQLVAAAADGVLLPGWVHQLDDLLVSQGRLSDAETVVVFDKLVIPHLADLQAVLRDGGAWTFLDVGAGVGRLSVSMAERYPAMQAVAVEPHQRAGLIAERNVREAGLAERIQVVHAPVQHLDLREKIDLVWLPYAFLDGAGMPDALTACYHALRPGGWLWLWGRRPGTASPRSKAAELRTAWWAAGGWSESTVLAELRGDDRWIGVSAVGNISAGDFSFALARRRS